MFYKFQAFTAVIDQLMVGRWASAHVLAYHSEASEKQIPKRRNSRLRRCTETK
jgi:hypothetical protein